VICVFYKTSVIALGPISLLSSGNGTYFSGGKAASALEFEVSYSLQLVPRLRKTGAVILLPYTPSWLVWGNSALFRDFYRL